MPDFKELHNQELAKCLDQHGRLTYINPLGITNILYGFIRKVEPDHIVWQDNETRDKFKIRNVIKFDPIELKIT